MLSIGRNVLRKDVTKKQNETKNMAARQEAPTTSLMWPCNANKLKN